MKYIVLILVVFLGYARAEDEGWLTDAPRDWNGGIEAKQLNEEMISEVIHTQVDQAKLMLLKKKALEISAFQAQCLTGKVGSLKKGHRYFLVRSKFGHGATGAYATFVSSNGKRVQIIHASLGDRVDSTQSALVLQLQRVPREVFASVGFTK